MEYSYSYSIACDGTFLGKSRSLEEYEYRFAEYEYDSNIVAYGSRRQAA